MRSLTFWCFAAAAIVGCSAAPSRTSFTSAQSGSSTSSGSGASNGNGGGISNGSTGGALGSGGSVIGLTTGSSSGAPGCSAAAELVYVLGDDNTLWSFDPPNKKFVKIGPIQCKVPDGAVPNSMAVDRNAVAWVNYVASDTDINGDPYDTAGSIYKVNTSDGSCASSPTVTFKDSAWYRVGMGFSTDTASGTSETLYVTGTSASSNSDSPGLGKIDMTKEALVKIGQFTGTSNDLSGQSAELTGTGDGRLFGFFTAKPIHVAQIDKTSGATPAATEATLSTVEEPAAWAFSFWGGDFYLYTAPDRMKHPSRTTNVTHFSPSTNTVDTTYMENIGFTIVGAGVSTCAPVVPPS